MSLQQKFNYLVLNSFFSTCVLFDEYWISILRQAKFFGYNSFILILFIILFTCCFRILINTWSLYLISYFTSKIKSKILWICSLILIKLIIHYIKQKLHFSNSLSWSLFYAPLLDSLSLIFSCSHISVVAKYVWKIWSLK